MCQVLGHMKSIGGLVNTLWNGLRLEDILYSLNAMYTIISNTGKCSVGVAIVSLVFCAMQYDLELCGIFLKKFIFFYHP